MGKITLLSSSLRVPGWLPGLALAVLFSCIFWKLAADVWIRKGFAFDRPMMAAVRCLASPWLTAVMQLVTDSGSGTVTTGLALVLSIHWWRQVERRAAAFMLLVTLTGSALLGQALKTLFARPRPQWFSWLTTARGWSFPSGHTLNAVVLSGLLAWLIGRQLSGWRRIVLWAVAGLWAGLVGLSRVYLGIHYPSDVLASLAVGGLCLLAALYGYRTSVSRSAAT